MNGQVAAMNVADVATPVALELRAVAARFYSAVTSEARGSGAVVTGRDAGAATGGSRRSGMRARSSRSWTSARRGSARVRSAGRCGTGMSGAAAGWTAAAGALAGAAAGALTGTAGFFTGGSVPAAREDVKRTSGVSMDNAHPREVNSQIVFIEFSLADLFHIRHLAVEERNLETLIPVNHLGANVKDL